MSCVLPFPGKPERNEARIKEAFERYTEALRAFRERDERNASDFSFYSAWRKRHDPNTPDAA